MATTIFFECVWHNSLKQGAAICCVQEQTASVWRKRDCGCRQWLQELSLGLTAAEESAPLLDNQLRNGVLLCDLAGKTRVSYEATR